MSIRTISLSILLALSSVAQARSGGYKNTCDGGYIDSSSNSLLRTKCGDGRGGHTRASIDLNGCVTNNGGHLAYQLGGGFAGSCKNIQVSYNGYLSANCGDGHGKYPYTNIDLNSIVGNTGGALVC